MNSTTSNSSSRAAGRDRRARREAQLVEAALDCIARLGLRDTTVPDVAARAHMAVGSISQYFESKERLFTAVLRSLAQEFESTWRHAVAAAGPDPALRLRAFVDTYFDATTCQRKKVAVWYAFWGEVKARPQYRAVCADYDRRHDEMLSSLCAGLIRAGTYRGLQAPAAAKLIASTCHGLWLEFLTGADSPGREGLAALSRQLLATLFAEHAPAFAAPARPKARRSGRGAAARAPARS
ncbi:MAG: TetR family transcriptional regulator C-terminal domain-containing protein [Proteobacteria bacterium]|nr:TetR family transcriptional regulator C-terminal domain-containing protein [Pseudomonadota bacterium]